MAVLSVPIRIIVIVLCVRQELYYSLDFVFDLLRNYLRLLLQSFNNKEVLVRTQCMYMSFLYCYIVGLINTLLQETPAYLARIGVIDLLQCMCLQRGTLSNKEL